MSLDFGQNGVLRIGEPATVEFSVASLSAGTPTGTECVTLPAGVEAVNISPNHRYNANTREICGVNQAGNTSSSRFVVRNTTELAFSGTGDNTTNTRGITSIVVTVEREEALLVDDADSTVKDTPVGVDLVGNDTIPAGSSVPDVDTTTAEGGTVVVNSDGTVTYTPLAGFTGTDTFTYRVTGPDGVEHEATVTITVTEAPKPGGPMIAPAFALAGLAGAGLVAAIRRRKA
jgi:MYXO-CTERM domain-containing protein